MTTNSDDDPSPDKTHSDVDESEIARAVDRYFDPSEEMGDDDLREHLEQDIRGTIIDLDPEGVGLTVIVEQLTDGDQTVRDSYRVKRVTDLDGEPALEWQYLGPVS